MDGAASVIKWRPLYRAEPHVGNQRVEVFLCEPSSALLEVATRYNVVAIVLEDDGAEAQGTLGHRR